jgi:hypothetical protein
MNSDNEATRNSVFFKVILGSELLISVNYRR